MTVLDRVRCRTCGEEHDLSDMQGAFAKPDAYFAVPPDERDQRCTWTDDLADIDRRTYFLRGVLEVPVVGERQPFAWGVWVRVPEADFRRYVAVYSDEGQAAEPPFTGWLANQIPRFPRTLGLEVAVRLTSPTTRPLVTVRDAAHPLAREQREGIHVERVLEHVSRFLHDDARPPVGEPAFATVAGDGWELESAVERFAARRDLYWLPPPEARQSLAPGHLAKVIFLIEASDERGEPRVHGERMWVEVDHARGAGAEALYSGVLTNEPHQRGLTRPGMRVWFTPDHVLDIIDAENRRASEAPGVLRCRSHGPSQRTYVCQHVLHGSGLGFHRADDPGNPRPDAWCDACEAMLAAAGDWTDQAEAAAGVTLVCAGCYDAAEERNRRGAAPR